MGYPRIRMRRLRSSPIIRDLVRETHLTRDDLIYPLFVCEGRNVRQEISTMPGVCRLSIDQLVREAEECAAAGVKAIILFGIPAEKDESGSSGFRGDGIVQKALRELKTRGLPLMLITDVCLCEYTSHGHCGLVRGHQILNDETVELLVRQAVSHVQAGADMVAPSDMMDFRVRAIREALNKNGFMDTGILSYAVKYASAYYGPFREAAHSAPGFGDRKTYQMDPANSREALKEARQDVIEGADMVMVKPALAYLDIVAMLRRELTVPIAAYNVSGEYSMVKAAAQKGWVDEKAIVLETLLSIKRAGADIIISYHAKDALNWMHEDKKF
ncbi:MAG: porphobilinogen synthase [Candidatus Omnitrophica bacterium]|nr:porphobilinogen synthase [Candidatus Omnitrophota bacterium]